MMQLPDEADVWLLAGQSNMAGSAWEVAYEAPSPDVWLFNLRDEWQVAEEPFMKYRYEAKDTAFTIMRGEKMRREAQGLAVDAAYIAEQAAVYPAQVTRVQGNAGLGLPFGKALAAHLHRPVGVIFCAKGDTRMEEWEPDYAGDPYMALYASALRRVRAAGRPVKGIIWYQGESDTFDEKGKVYADCLRKLVAAFRRDLEQPDLPFIYVQIAACVMQTEEELPDWNLVQESQRRLEAELAPGGMVSAIDLPLCDGIHLSRAAHRRLGPRIAKVVSRQVYGDTKLEIGPRPVSVMRDPADPCQLIVQYASVNGRLLPEDHIAGFSIHAPGSDRNLVCNALVAPDDPSTVLIRAYLPIPPGSVLWYGKGLMPYCNLTDAEDLAGPVFGPWQIPD
ncbi:MAG: sialate O-acetylesterase [Armatimonadota bacterium]